jgi:hypothetical protein
MEKSILIQGLVYLSNEFGSATSQLSLIRQFIVPILEFFQTSSVSIGNVESFIKFTGADCSTDSATTTTFNRKMIFFYVNCLFGILKCITFIPPGGNYDNSGLSVEQSSLFIQLFEFLIQLLRSFNSLHTAAYQHVVNRELLDMTDSAKLMILGMQQVEKHAGNLSSAAADITSTAAATAASNADNPEKISMFMFFFVLLLNFDIILLQSVILNAN